MSKEKEFSEQLLRSRAEMLKDLPRVSPDPVEEGGCGVVGFTASVPISGKNIFQASIQMHNRGNGKGGGIAAAGLVAKQLGVDSEILKNDYILQIALLNPDSQQAVEDAFITPDLEVHHKEKVDHVDDYKAIGLEVCPPDIVRYFVRVKKDSLVSFAEENGLQDAESRFVEDEFIYRNSFKLNQRFYASLGEKEAFVMSHARNLVIFKIVGYAEQVVEYYKLEDFQAHVWIAHQRYPTKGRVWHPAGAHPFIGMNEALVHNGDFANYFSIAEYLRQHNVVPQFLTDTEVSVLIFDMLTRVYKYPVEYVIEALAPTTELDFEHLPAEKKKIYKAIQSLHMHGSPDGPWFFIIARSNPDEDMYQLLGITDTAMLRPQVFAIQEGDVSIGLVGSEKQAIDATLLQLSASDPRFRPVADRYWNARGGSHTDGGAFSFTVSKNGDAMKLVCADKFGNVIDGTPGSWQIDNESDVVEPECVDSMKQAVEDLDVKSLFSEIVSEISSWNFGSLKWILDLIKNRVDFSDSRSFNWAIEILSMLNDRRFDCGSMKRSVVLQLVRETLDSILDNVPSITDHGKSVARRISRENKDEIRSPEDGEEILVVYARKFTMEGNDCNCRLEVLAHEQGWKHFIIYGLIGQRFTGCGFGPESRDVRIDVFGSSGDYLASGIDGMEIHVHDNAQDQLGQILKDGKLIIHGDAGQAFMYGAKGGDVYVLGSAAGRPLINAVGHPRVVINGTCLDFLAESFMAGDPLNGGGFVVLNGMQHDDRGKLVELDSPYPGANMFSLASGGAIFVRDPHNKLVDDQLNGAEFVELSDDDWNLIFPYLEANEKYFGVSVESDLLTVNGVRKDPKDVYRKVQPSH